MLLLELQEATPEEVQRWRREVRDQVAESDKLDRGSVKDGEASLREVQRLIADRLQSLQAAGKLTPAKLGEVQAELGELTRRWAQSYAQRWREQFGPRAYELGDQLVVKGVGAAGLRMALDRRGDLDLQQSVEFDESLVYRAAAEVNKTAMKLVRLTALAGRNWQDVRQQLLLDPKKSIYWESAHKATRSAARTWAASVQADASLRRFQELADRTGGAVKMLFVLMDTQAGCTQCPPHAGKVYEVRGGQAPRLPLHPNCRCTYVPYYARPGADGGLDPVSPTPSPMKGRDFEDIVGIQPHVVAERPEKRPLMDSPFDARGTSYAEDALAQPAPRIARVRDYSKFAERWGAHLQAYDGKLVNWLRSVEDHVIGDHQGRDAERRVAWLEALPLILRQPEFVFVKDSLTHWIGRARLGEQTKILTAIAAPEGGGYSLRTFFPVDGGVRAARRRIEDLRHGT
jgi:hypothetical protein